MAPPRPAPRRPRDAEARPPAAIPPTGTRSATSVAERSAVAPRGSSPAAPSPRAGPTPKPPRPSVALGPGEARLAAWAHLLPPLGSLVVCATHRAASPGLVRVLSQANRLGGGLLAVLVALSLLSYVAEGGSRLLLGVLGFLFLVALALWVGGSAFLAWRATRGHVPLLSLRTSP